LPVNAIRYNGDLLGTFQRWNGSAWANMMLEVAGGGTGADNATLARTNLGLGTMAVQNSNAVNIIGGTISGMSSIQGNVINGSQLLSADGSGINGLDASKIAYGVINPLRLANGTPNSTVFLRGDSSWAAPAGTLPSGLIAMFDVACPAGWTRVAAWDGRYPRAAAVYGAAGGAYSHTHGHTLASGSHSHGAGTYTTVAHNHGGTVSISISGTTSSHSGHTHSFSDSFSGTTDSAGSQMNVDAGGSGYMSRSDHNHSFSGDVSGTTGSGGSHSHTFSGSDTDTIASSSPDVTGTSAAATAPLSGSITAVDHQPPFIDVVFCKKD
jgi:hypothetical protein